MNHKNNKIFLAALCLLLLCSFAGASILATTTTDKASIATDEVARMDVKLLNDSDQNVANVSVKIQTDSELVLIDGQQEKTVLIQKIDKIPAGKAVDIVMGIKAVSAANPASTIYVYYGTEDPLRSASATLVGIKDLPISVKETANRQTINGVDTIVIDFKLTNHSKETYFKASAEAVPPIGYDLNIAPVFADSLPVEGSIEKTFDVPIPVDAIGDQTVTLAYGFFDSDGPHYFQKQFTFAVQRQNYGLIALAGVIVLAIAVLLFVMRGKPAKGAAVNGTVEKDKGAKGKK